MSAHRPLHDRTPGGAGDRAHAGANDRDASDAHAGADRRALARRLVAPVIIGLVVAFAFVGLYTAALHAPKPHDLRVAVVGAPGLERQIQGRLDAAAPGAFALERYASPAAARQALLDQDVGGAFIAGPQPRLLVATAGGPATREAIGAAFSGAAAANGTKLEVEDVRPLPAHDSRGMSAFFTIVGTTVASLLFGAALFAGARRAPIRARLAVAVAFSALVGLTMALTVGPLVGALSGAFWGIAGVIALLALAVGLTTAALSRALGPPGIGIAALVLLLFGMSSSGGPVGYQFLPDTYNALSQAQPGGAAMTAMRNVVYFDGAGTLGPILVLLAWVLFGLLVELAAARIRPGAARRRPALAPSASPSPSPSPT